MKFLAIFNNLTTKKRRTGKSGSALLIAILIMGVLMTLTLGLSDLVIREIAQTRDIVTAGQAYFGAEAGVENALLDLQQHFPGYETENYQTFQQKDLALDYKYRILNQGDKIPYLDPDQPIYLGPDQAPVSPNEVYKLNPQATYHALALNESAVIPLYVDDGKGNYNDVQDFLIQYYADFGSSKEGWLVNNIEKVDILRWKLFGRPCLSQPCTPDAVDPSKAAQTDAISDFYPTASGANPSQPVCLGTDSSIDNSCFIPQTENGVMNAARECYQTDAGGLGGNDIQSLCTISEFVKGHTQNYVILTNIINPDVINASNLELEQNKKKTTIYYRIIAKPGQKLVRQEASISADGYSGNRSIKQSIDVNIASGSFLPVFNFSLYHTEQ